ncbi:MAG: hypothetical protein U0840_20785 [Gemmataceae bacterium]
MEHNRWLDQERVLLSGRVWQLASLNDVIYALELSDQLNLP